MVLRVIVVGMGLWLIAVPLAHAAVGSSGSVQGHRSITDTRIGLPSLDEVIRVLTLRDYNTRLVVVSTSVLGMAAGVVGSFLLLRKRSLIGDTLSHATLPGIALAFMVMVIFGGEGKYLPGLLAGAGAFGLLGVGGVLLIRHTTRLKDDAAMGVVLSVFFGLGVALLGVIQNMPGGNKAGLESFILGKTASMVFDDFVLICVSACVCVLVCLLFFKEFRLLCFDEHFAKSRGWPVYWLDMMMLGLVAVVTVVGLQAVGLILMIALLITPAAAARFWTESLPKMMVGAALIGGASGWFGATFSALVPRMPAGAVIVLVAAMMFVLSMVFGSARGAVVLAARRWRLNGRVGRQHLLRAMYELREGVQGEKGKPGAVGMDVAVGFNRLLAVRSWKPGRLRGLIRGAGRAGLLEPTGVGGYRLTPEGLEQAVRQVRNHRLWEMYLITHADIAPSHVDRDADQVEHVLGVDLVAQLESLLDAKFTGKPRPVPVNPHGM